MSNPTLDPAFGLTRVQIVSFFERIGESLHPEGSTSPQPIGYSLQTGVGIDEKSHEVGVTVTLGADVAPPGTDIRDLSPESPGERIAEIVAACSFHIADIDSLRVDGRVVVPATTLGMFVGVTISTARGLLVGRAQHRVFGEAPFPVIGPLEVVRDLAESDGIDWIGPVPPAA